MLKVWIAGANGQIGQALNDYLCSLADDHAAYSKKEAQQILLGLLEQL